MPPLVRTVGVAILIWLVVGFLLVVVFGPLLLTLDAPPTTFVGNIFVEWGWAIGLVIALWYVITGGTWGAGFRRGT